MKRIKTIILCITATFYILCACTKQSSSENKEKEEKETQIQTQEAYYYKYEDQKIYITQKIEEAVAALGDNYEYFEAPSCAAQGMDMFYYYQNLTVRANEIEGEKVVTEIYFKNDTVATPEGIRITSSYADVIAKYGNDYKTNGTALEYIKGDTLLLIDMKDGKVAAVTYQYK